MIASTSRFAVRSSVPQKASLAAAGRRGLAVPVDNKPSGERKQWEREEIQALYDSPLLELVFKSASVHRAHHDPSKIQLSVLTEEIKQLPLADTLLQHTDARYSISRRAAAQKTALTALNLRDTTPPQRPLPC